jgi:hypothetical protein
MGLKESEGRKRLVRKSMKFALPVITLLMLVSTPGFAQQTAKANLHSSSGNGYVNTTWTVGYGHDNH